MIRPPGGPRETKNLLHAPAGFKANWPPAVLGGARAPWYRKPVQDFTSERSSSLCLMSWRAEIVNVGFRGPRGAEVSCAQ